MSAVGARVALAAVAISLIAALFFTSTYVLNRAIATGGGHWAWSAALRYFFTLPLLLPLMRWQGGTAPVHAAIRAQPLAWLRCSVIGFVLFCACLTFAADSAPAWLIAGSFQITVIAGMLLAPLLYRDARRRIPRRALALGSLVFGGVLLMQFGHFDGALDRAAWIALAAVVVAAFAYPLGNRMLLLHLERSGESLNATQRVYGMTLVSQPVWWLVAGWAWWQAGWPGGEQMLLAAGVALGSGVIATVLFFQATGLVRNHPTALGATEAMQGAEILFATALGVLLLGEHWPQGSAAWGAAMVFIGIVAFGLLAGRQSGGDDRATRVLRSDRGA
jgi:drug/metabolite transporter (DMT)-like permease